MSFPNVPLGQIVISLGTEPKTADDFREEFRRSEIQLDRDGDALLSSDAFMVSKKERFVELVVMSMFKLGVDSSARYSDIIKKAKAMGLDLCPAEVGPQLRLQYKQQPYGENLAIAMEPITNLRRIFRVVHDDGWLWLIGSTPGPDGLLTMTDRLVFFRGVYRPS